MAPSWPVQFAFTLQRNLRIKSRDPGHTFQEIILPIYIIALLVLVKTMAPEIEIPAIPMELKSDAFCDPVRPGAESVCIGLRRPLPETMLAYVPQKNEAVKSLIMNIVQDFTKLYVRPALSPRGFDSEDDMLDFYYSHPDTLFAAIVFEDRDILSSQTLTPDLRYSIRMNGSYIPSTTQTIANKEDCLYDYDPCDATAYLQSGFLALQSVIAQAIRAASLPSTNCTSQITKSTFVQQQAIPAFHRSFASLEFQLFTAVYMVLALSPVLQTTLTSIVREKEILVKDCMMLMGLRESVYWVAWFTTYALMSGVSTLILVFIAQWTSLFVYTNTAMLFAIIFPFTLSLITMAFALSALFSKAQSATSFSGLWIFCSSLVIIPIDLLRWTTPICTILSLNSPVALALAMDVIVRAEGKGRGMTFSNFWSTQNGKSPLSIGALVGVFYFDALVYGIIAWYLDNAWPHPERGPKRPWNFCFTLHYWFPSSMEPSYMLAPQDNPSFVSQSQLDEASFVVSATTDMDIEADERPAALDDPNMEAVDPEITRKAVVVCKDLRKAYYQKKKWWQFWDVDGGRGQGSRRQNNVESEIIKGLNLTLYEGQLFAFVGHSKSGKSALLSILAGLSQGTSGEAYVYGLPVSDGGQELRSMIGFCPQGEIGLELLTVREQLMYFGRIKGDSSHAGMELFEQKKVPSKPLTERVDSVIEEFQLTNQADTMVMEINESARRKLSLAIALIGDPQVVFMDHPTARMDADAKKVFWDVLKNHQEGRVFVFTTDSMEEADRIADRKAVLSHGVVKCCGSSHFLRSRFGLSYLLHVTRQETFNGSEVLALVQRHIPDAVQITTARGQLHCTYKIPLGYPSETCALLTELTAKASQLGTGDGSLEATTLEEVFMQFLVEDEEEARVLPNQDINSVENWDKDDEDLEGEALLVNNDSHVMDDSARHTKKARLHGQTLAMLRSRFALYRRNIIAVLLTFGLPVVIAVGVLLIQSVMGNYDKAGLRLTSSELGKSIPIYYAASDDNAALQASSLLDKLGPNHILLNETSLRSKFGINEVSHADGRGAIGVSFDQLNLQSCEVEYNVLFDSSHLHELPTVVAMLDNSLLSILHKYYSSNESSANPMTVKVDNHPLPFAQLRTTTDVLVIMLMTLGLLAVPPVLGTQVIVDRELGLLSLFRVSGMRGLAYWMATAISDLILYYMAAFLVLGIGIAFGHVPFYKDANLAIFFLFLTTIPALAFSSYVASFFVAAAQGAATLLYMFFILAALVPYFGILAVPGDISYGWHSFLNVVDPPYALISGLHFVVNSINEVKDIGAEKKNSRTLYTFEWNAHILLSIGGAALAIVPLALFIWMLDQHDTDPEPKILDIPAGGDEVAAEANTHAFQDGAESMNDLNGEKERVQSNAARWESMGLMGGDGPEGDLILCCGIGKNYYGSNGTCLGIGACPGTWILRNLWLAVGRGEVVVLVGGQKSGKSSLISTLARTTPLSFGDALVNGESVRYGYPNHRRFVGLCPQFEAVYYSLTVREHLELFAVLKGVPQPRSLAVEAVIQSLNLTAVADQTVGKCSSGLRRRLSIAIAMVGGSSVLLLDEPSSGTDAATRRKVWKQLAAQSGQRATLICTPSFEEAEAVGVRVGIMVSGQLKCLASPHELKRRYGSTYSLSVSAAAESIPAIRDFISSLYPNTEQATQTATDSNGHADTITEEVSEGPGEVDTQYKFRVPIQSLSGLAALLREIEDKKEALGIIEYVVSQPTLRQVFHRLTLGESGESISS